MFSLVWTFVSYGIVQWKTNVLRQVILRSAVALWIIQKGTLRMNKAVDPSCLNYQRRHLHTLSESLSSSSWYIPRFQVPAHIFWGEQVKTQKLGSQLVMWEPFVEFLLPSQAIEGIFRWTRRWKSLSIYLSTYLPFLMPLSLSLSALQM